MDLARRIPWLSLLGFVVVLCLNRGQVVSTKSCKAKNFGHGSIVCVCNATYCDEVEDVEMECNEYAVYTSSKDGERFNVSRGHFRPHSHLIAEKHVVEFHVNSSIKYQRVKGFGAAFTDTAAMHLRQMVSHGLYENAMESYFSPTKGIRFTMGRVPMAASDFSPRVYSYDDVEDDFELKHFSLAKEDLEYKIPVILDAMNRTDGQLRLFASPWSAPGWLKINNRMIWGGIILGKAGDQYHKTWADYFVRFLDAYKAQGVDIWGITPGNDPVEGLIPGCPSPSTGYDSEMERDFIKLDLGPALHAGGYGNVSLMILDDQRTLLPDWASIVVKDPEARKYVSGIAVQWYTDKAPSSIFNIAATHILYPHLFILGSEARSGYSRLKNYGVLLGSWERGETHSADMLDDLNHWMVGWLEYCLVVNTEGGPNWVNIKTDAPIVVDYDKGVFYKQPMFYHMGHISRFVPPGSVRIDIELNDLTHLKYGAFLTPNDKVVIVIMNPENTSQSFHICGSGHNCIHTHIKPRAIQTYVWNK